MAYSCFPLFFKSFSLMKFAVLEKTNSMWCYKCKPKAACLLRHKVTNCSVACRHPTWISFLQDERLHWQLLSPVPHGWHGSPLSSCFALIASALTASDPPWHPPNCLWIDDEPGNQRRQSDENSVRRRERRRSCAADRIAKRRERLCGCMLKWTQQLWN